MSVVEPWPGCGLQGYDNTSTGTGGGIGQKIKQMIPGKSSVKLEGHKIQSARIVHPAAL